MRPMKWLGKTIEGTMRVTFGFTSVFLFAALVLSAVTIPAKTAACDRSSLAYLQYSPIHADIVLPAASLSEQTRSQIALPDNPDYFVFGLGDRDIFVNTPTWGDLKIRYALQALLLPSRQVIHLEPADEVSSAWIKLDICEDQRMAIERYVMDSFEKDGNGKTQVLEDLTYTGYDRFYEATGLYTMFKSCNNWVNGAMKAAGLKAPIWSPFSQGVTYHARRQDKSANFAKYEISD